MINSKVLIEEAETPNIFVDGIKYELFCELQAKDGNFQSLYIKEGSSDVVIEIGKKSAIVGLFSTDENKLKQLFEYIETAISPSGDLSCYDSEKFPQFLNLAEKAGGHYPTIQNDINPQKKRFFAGLLQRIRPQISLNKELQKQISEHIVSVEYNYQTVEKVHEADEILTSYSPAENLPKGWEWKDLGDGSGHLNSPEGKSYFFYDRAPYVNLGGIEYKETPDGKWDVYWGFTSDFFNYAESVVNEKYLDNKAISYNKNSLSDITERFPEQHGFQLIDSYSIDDRNALYSVSLESGCIVDVKVCTDTGLVYVMQNHNGSTVHGEADYDVTFPDYSFNEDAVVSFVKDEHQRRIGKTKHSLSNQIQSASTRSAETSNNSNTKIKEPEHEL